MSAGGLVMCSACARPAGSSFWLQFGLVVCDRCRTPRTLEEERAYQQEEARRRREAANEQR